MAHGRWWLMAFWLSVGLWGCQPAPQQAGAPARSPQEQRWIQAILDDARRPCTMQILLSTGGDEMPKVIEYERPHPDFVRMTERSATGCMIGGKAFYPTTFLTPEKVIHWYPSQSRCRIVPRAPDKAGRERIAQLFAQQARLRVVGREQSQGQDWVIVEASVPGGFTTRRYWIRAQGEPQIGRIMVRDMWGRVMGDETRTQIQPVAPTAQPFALPEPPRDWQIERVVNAPLTKEDKARLKAFKPPQGYQLISATRRTCPCDSKQLSLVALYSNGMDEFSVFFAAPGCGLLPASGNSPIAGSDKRGVVVAARRADGWGIVIVGEVQPELAREAVSRWTGKP
ncbi:MAG: hypothetical protein WHT28_11950 [Fimbriimonadales bacterium]